MIKLSISKRTAEEVPLRKALYWMSQFCEWTLDENPDEWVVKFYNYQDAQSLRLKFSKLLNDYLLRAELNLDINEIKAAIIRKSLTDLSKS